MTARSSSSRLPRQFLSQSIFSASCSRVQFAIVSRPAALSLSRHHSGLRFFGARARPATRDKPTNFLAALMNATALSSHSAVIYLHARIAKSGYQHDVVVGTALVDALAKCSDANSARKMFDELSVRDAAAWNVMLSSCARSGDVEQAWSLVSEMGSSGVRPNAVTLSVLLQVCGGLEDKRFGRSVHAYAIRYFHLVDTFLINSLIVFYNKLGDWHISERIFWKMLKRDTVSWNAMMAGLVWCEFGWRALELFNLMRAECQLDPSTIEAALRACALEGDDLINFGLAIHGLVLKLAVQLDVHGQNSLLLFYSKCGLMDACRSIFDEMEARNIVSWNVLLDGYIQIRCPEEVLNLVGSIRFNYLGVSSDLFVSTLQASRLLGQCRKIVMSIHCLVVVMGFAFDGYVNSSLISAYGDCGTIDLARRILDLVVAKTNNNIVLWNAMLSVYICNLFYSDALQLLSRIHANGCIIDAVTLVNMLSVCTGSLDLLLGKVIHGYMIRNKFDSNVFATAALLEYYAKCGALAEACYVFIKIPIRNRVTWNTMIHCCVRNNFSQMSLKLFYLMQEQDHFVPDATTVVGVIEAIAHRGYEGEKNFIHKYVIERGFVNNEFVANSMIEMHARFCDFDKAMVVFDRTSKLSVITWNTLISGYCNYGIVKKAISVFHIMKSWSVTPDSTTFLCLLRASTVLGSLESLMQVHAIVCKDGYESNMFVSSSLLYGYAKCGDLSMASLIFDGMKYKSTVSWNSMIQAYGMHGNAEKAHELFSQMQQFGIVPTMVTFLIILSACSHVGDIEKGKHYFELMTQMYSLVPNRKHLSSLVDLLGRRGLLKEAHEALEKISLDPGLHAWGALLSGCRVQGDYQIGTAIANKVLEFDPFHYGYNLLLSNMYRESGRWMAASKIRNNLDNMGLKKVSGCSMVECPCNFRA